MTVVPITPEQPQVELIDRMLLVHEFSCAGTIIDVAHDLELQGDPPGLAQLLTAALEVGAVVLRNGQSRAQVELVALEIDRLIATAHSATEKLPNALQGPLAGHLERLSDLLAEHFDPERTRSLQNQLKTIIGTATRAELRALVQEILSENGAVGAQLKYFASSNTDTLTRVNTILNRIEHKLQLDQAFERSVHKGRPFEEVVQAELEAIHAPLGDEVRCVRSEYGLLGKTGKGTKAGDYVVTVNPGHTRGRNVCYVIEVKTGPLGAPSARRELETAIKNRGAAAGVLVFDGLDDAPLGGRSYMPHGDGRFTAVLDLKSQIALAFEIACHGARQAAIASVRVEGQLEPGWIQAQCNRLCDVIEEASAMLRSVGSIERGASEIRERYTQMRKQALALVDEMRERAE